MSSVPATALQLRSHISADAILQLSFEAVEVPQPGPNEVVVRVEAAPINPSDLGLLLATADVEQLSMSGDSAARTLTAPLIPGSIKAFTARIGQSLPVGNEAGGIVVAAGSSAAAQAMIGKVVGMFGGAMYCQYRTVPVDQCLVIPDGITPAEAASPFVNPMTALGMVETMRLEGHSALGAHRSASNLGQMLVKICQADGVELVNVVRRDEQVALLTDLGASHVVNTASPDFISELTQALIETRATIGFDAVGGGRLASQILGCMEAAASAGGSEYNRYGSTTFKQIYIYGALDQRPTEIVRNFGWSWALSGWLLTPFLQKIGSDGVDRLRDRVAKEITTTFASAYTETVSLAEALDPEHIRRYARRATGEKYLIAPHA